MIVISQYVDNCIERFATMIHLGEGWIAKDDVLRQFTTRFNGFDAVYISKEGLEKYVIDELQNWYGVEVREGCGE